MYGPWNGEKSKLYRALLSVGFANEAGGAGGSFGYGKAGLIGASAVRAVIAYTCFREQADDPGVTRRLLGMAYWGQHSLGDRSFTGFAPFGDQGDGAVPFENEEADRVAMSLGLKRRDPGQIGDLGTTMLVVEPTVEPEDLLVAVERSWWPALEDSTQRFSVVIRTPDGNSHYPRPRRNEVLASFSDAYELATTPGNVPKNCWHIPLRRVEEYERPGSLGLVCDREGWSFPEIEADPDVGQNEQIEHRSLVALIRDPRMVVEYLEAGTKAPYVRGVFVAGDSVNDVLRATEPKAHDAWQAIDNEQGRVAAQILRRVKQGVIKARRELSPPRHPPETIELAYFDRLMKLLMSGQGSRSSGPVAETRDLTINLHHQSDATADGQIELSGHAVIGFSEHFEADQAVVEVAIAYRYLEEDRVGDLVDLDVELPSGFAKVPDTQNCFRGTLVRGQNARFEFLTNPYSAEWTGRLVVSADIVDGDNP